MDATETAPAVPNLTFRKKLLFAVVSCVLVLAGIEGAWRLVYGWSRDWRDCHRWHPSLGWTLREGWHGKFSWTGGWSRINAQGIRDDHDVGPKSPTEKRLLVLGDSVTFGAKVPTSDTFPHQLEMQLQQAGTPWRVLNGGVTSYDPSQEAEWLELFGWSLQPDVLVVAFCANDLYSSRRSQSQTVKPAGGLNQWLTDHSLLAHKMQRLLWRMQASLGVARVTEAGPQGSQGSSSVVGWQPVEAAYRKIAEAARSRHVPVVLMQFPTLDEIQGKTRERHTEKLAAITRDLGWRFVNLDPAFRDEGDPSRLFLPADPIHPSTEGYARAGRHAAAAEDLLTALRSITAKSP